MADVYCRRMCLLHGGEKWIGSVCVVRVGLVCIVHFVALRGIIVYVVDMKEMGLTSLRLRALTFVCSLAVVLIHCVSMEPWLRGEADGSVISAAVRFLGTYTFVRIAVPSFFVMSGFFLAMSTKGYSENLKRRFITLYIPFVIWNAANVGLLMKESLELGVPVITTDGAKIWKNHAGVTYLDGFVAATIEERVKLLKDALGKMNLL